MARLAHMAGSLAVIAPSAATRPRGSTGRAVQLLEHLPRLLRPHRPWLRLDEAQPESVVSYHGAVEIRQIRAGFTVQTCVKGEPDRARATALQRLAQFLAGYNRSGTPLHAAGPIVQREEASGRWLVSVDLPGVEDAFVAAASRNGKVQIRPTQTEFHAILRMSGRPTPEAIAGGVTAISAALAGTMWWPAGGPMVRLHRPPAILPFANRFEVALPITRLRYATPFQRGACGDARRHWAAKQGTMRTGPARSHSGWLKETPGECYRYGK